MSGVVQHLGDVPIIVDRVLWEVAVHGGNCRKAHQALVARADSDDALLDLPVERTVRKWVTERWADRYAEIRSIKAGMLDEQVARDAASLAVAIEEGERKALQTTIARLGEADGVEASQILRNLSQSKKIQVDSAGALRGRAAFDEAVRSLQDIARSLSRIPGVELVDDDGRPAFVDADVVELD